MNILGVDEVGRGCIAGPVVACAVVLSDDYSIEEIKDSKKLSASRREKVCEIIKKDSLGIGLGVVSNEEIDKKGIVLATQEAMYLAIDKLKVSYDYAIIDAVSLEKLKIPYISPFKADENYIAVAYASIYAKVYRDKLMYNNSLEFPNYGWEKNKGYGTKEHFSAISSFGISRLHRKSFLTKYNI